MANKVYTKATEIILLGDLHWDTDDIRILLVDSSTTADTELDAATISSFSTLGELSGSGYVRKALTSKAVNRDDANDRSEFDAADVTWTAINAGTAQAAIIYKHVTDDTDSVPLLYIDGGDFPLVTNGSDATIVWDVEGILQAGTA